MPGDSLGTWPRLFRGFLSSVWEYGLIGRVIALPDRALPLVALEGFSLQKGKSWRKFRVVLAALAQNLDKLPFRAFYSFFEGHFLGSSCGLDLAVSIDSTSTCRIHETGFLAKSTPKTSNPYSDTFDGFMGALRSLGGRNRPPFVL